MGREESRGSSVSSTSSEPLASASGSSVESGGSIGGAIDLELEQFHPSASDFEDVTRAEPG